MEKDIKYFKAGDKLTAQALNEMLDNIAFNEEKVNEVQQATENVENFTSAVDQKATNAYNLADTALSSAQEAKRIAEEAKVDIGIEKGTGIGSTQQIPREDKVTIAEGEDVGHFDFTGHSEAKMSGRIQYGAVGNYSASMNGRSAALNKHAFAINNSTIAKGEESFAQGYETVAEGNSSFAGGTRTYAKGAATITFGDRAVAKGDYSSAFGVHTVAEDNYQTVVGVANEIGDAAESLFEVGNGELDEDGNVVSRSTAFRVMREGKVKIKDIWAKDDDDVIALGFFNHKMDNEYLPTLKESILTTIGEAIDPYLVVTSEREDKTSIQMKGCVANDRGAVALGTSTYATGQHSVALGCGAESSAMCAIAIGMNSKSTGEASFSVGVNAIAGGAHSRAMGTNINAGYVYQTVIGKNNANKEGTLFEIGNGADTENRSNVFEVYTEGLVAVGNKVQQLPDNVVEGFDFTDRNSIAAEIDEDVNIWNSGAEPVPYGATGEFAAAFGGKSAAIGKRSFAEGTTTIAKGKYSHAEGDNAVALGDQSHAEGYATTSVGLSSHAEGVSTLTNGQGAHAEGLNTKATAEGAHAEGLNTEASGVYSHAEGNHTKALHNNSHAGGFYTKTGGSDQTVIGHFNIGKADTLFEVGNGDGKKDSNAFEVYADGDIGIYKDGKIYSLHKILSVYFTDINLK